MYRKREWDNPPLWFICVSILLIAGAVALGISLMNSMENLAEAHHFDRRELPLLRLFLGYMTLPFAVVAAVANISFFYLNIKYFLLDVFENSSFNKTYKFRK